MKALSVKQPWATLIVTGEKNIENRTWKTNHRGPMAIHASKTPDRKAMDFFKYMGMLPDRELEYGAIVGYVDLVDIVTESDSVWFQGPYGWVLESQRESPFPVLMKGKLGVWEYEDAV